MTEKKICPDCGAENRAEGKFCAQCGRELPLQNANTISCSHCGEDNPASAKFCSDCGHPLGRKRSKKSSAPKSKAGKKKQKTTASRQSTSSIKIAAAVIGALLIYFFMTDNQTPERRQTVSSSLPVAEQKLSDPALESKAMEIVSKFICSCGGCGEDPLEECDCETARGERNYIRQAVANGGSMEDIIREVNLKFGWIKPQFKDKYGPGKPTVDLKKEQFKSPLPSSPVEQELTVKRLASLADRLTIISKFACPCGQCSIDELKDCECNHPRGAQEVKRFIDNKIAAGKYSIENIVQLVETQYGNRIR